jgi:multiple sugar transport system substrate-binding protein
MIATQTLLRCLVLTGTLCVALAGCVKSSDSSHVVIRMANWGGASEETEFEATIRRLREEFQRNNPGVEVRVERIPGSQEYVSKMLLSFVAGTEPDIMALDASSAAVFINNGVLLDLAPLIASDPTFRLADYYENVVSIAKRGDKLFAIPGDFTPMVLYYNRKLFREAGIEEPKPGWTYYDFLDAARKLTIVGSDGKTVQWGFKFANWMPGWITWIWNNGGDVLSPTGDRATGYFDSAQTVEALTFLRDLVTKYRVAPSLSSTAATGVDPFLAGKAAMEISGHWAMVGYKEAKELNMEDIGVAPVPTNLPAERGKRTSTTVMYEMGFAIGKNCKHPDAAWKFIKFCTGKRYQEVYNSTGIAVCARKDVSQARAADERERRFLEIVPSARAPWGSVVEGYAFVETTGVQAMDRILAGEDPKRVARQAAQRIDEYFRIR